MGGQLQMQANILPIDAAPQAGFVTHQQPKGQTSEWMFGDAATGWLGIHALAHLNPLRWSGAQSFEKTIRDLEDVAQHENRAIILKIPAGVSTPEQNFANATEAINYMLSAVAENAASDAQEELLRTQQEFSPQQGGVVAEPMQVAPVLSGAAGRLARAGFAVQ